MWLPGQTPSGCLHGARAPSSVYLGMWNRLSGRVQIRSTPRRRINRSFRPLCTSRDCVPCAVISPRTDQLVGLNLKLLPPCIFVGKERRWSKEKVTFPSRLLICDRWLQFFSVAFELSSEQFHAALLQGLSQHDTTASAARCGFCARGFPDSPGNSQTVIQNQKGWSTMLQGSWTTVSNYSKLQTSSAGAVRIIILIKM